MTVRTFPDLSPDGALLLFTIGMLLIYVELNRPGCILPGAIGVLSFLLSIASISRFSLRPSAVSLIVVSTIALAYNLFRPVRHSISLAAAIVALFGFVYLVRGPGAYRIHPPVAALCGLILGVTTPLLANIARRAHMNKKGKIL